MKLIGTSFQIKVWKEIIKIPKGKTKTYKEIAINIGHPNSARAVANACGKNPYPKENEINHAETHIKNIVSNFLPSVLNYLNVNFENTNQIVLGASMGGLMSVSYTHLTLPTTRCV